MTYVLVHRPFFSLIVPLKQFKFCYPSGLSLFISFMVVAIPRDSAIAGKSQLNNLKEMRGVIFAVHCCQLLVLKVD